MSSVGKYLKRGGWLLAILASLAMSVPASAKPSAGRGGGGNRGGGGGARPGNPGGGGGGGRPNAGSPRGNPNPGGGRPNFGGANGNPNPGGGRPAPPQRPSLGGLGAGGGGGQRPAPQGNNHNGMGGRPSLGGAGGGQPNRPNANQPNIPGLGTKPVPNVVNRPPTNPVQKPNVKVPQTPQVQVPNVNTPPRTPNVTAPGMPSRNPQTVDGNRPGAGRPGTPPNRPTLGGAARPDFPTGSRPGADQPGQHNHMPNLGGNRPDGRPNGRPDGRPVISGRHPNGGNQHVIIGDRDHSHGNRPGDNRPGDNHNHPDWNDQNRNRSGNSWRNYGNYGHNPYTNWNRYGYGHGYGGYGYGGYGWGGGRGYPYAGGYGGNPRYSWYNGNFYNGGWYGNRSNNWYRPFMWGTLTGWGLSSVANGWGYNYGNYYNPYYGGLGGNYATVYNYAQPVAAYDYYDPGSAVVVDNPQLQATPVVDSTAFDQGLASFKAGDYQGSLTFFDSALQQQPKDPVIHEVRALALFAVGAYQPAAAALNALLSSSPGMDWTTCSALYGNVNDYTVQLRQLEAYCKANPKDAAAYFVLAYQYMVTGARQEAASTLQIVLQIQPKDVVARQLLDTLVPPEAAPPANAAPANPNAYDGDIDLAGNWQATAGDTTIILTVTPDSKFTWKAASKGQPEVSVNGDLTSTDDELVMTSKEHGDMGGSVTPLSANQWQFRPTGAPPSDPGLVFNRM